MISDYLSTLITNSRVVDFKSGKRIKFSIPTLHFDDGFVLSRLNLIKSAKEKAEKLIDIERKEKKIEMSFVRYENVMFFPFYFV